MRKRGISAIVATVLIILITVAAIVIIWAFILPTVGEDFEVVNIEVELSIVSSEDIRPGMRVVELLLCMSKEEEIVSIFPELI